MRHDFVAGYRSFQILLSQLLIVFAFHGLSSAQWVHTNGPFGGVITSLAVKPNDTGGFDLFAGTPDGVFLSIDGGDSWKSVNSENASRYITVLAVSPDGNNVMLGTVNGLFRTTNLGIDWIESDSGMSTRDITSITFVDTLLFAAARDGHTYSSVNLGVSWVQRDSGISGFTVQTLTANGGSLFAGTENDGIFRTTDNGVSWKAVDSGLTYLNIFSLGVVENSLGEKMLLAGTGDGVFRSANDGMSWGKATSGIPPGRHVSSFAVVDSLWYAGTQGAYVYVSTNSGLSWTLTDSGLANSYVNALIAIGHDLFAGTYGGAFRTSIPGNVWSQTSIGLPYIETSYIYIAPRTGGGTNLWASTYTSGVFLSSDNGNNWISTTYGLPNFGIFSFFVSGSYVYAGTTTGVYSSTNDGANWTDPSSGLFTQWIGCFGQIDSSLFVGTVFGAFRSTDHGKTWNEVAGLPQGSANAFATSETTIFAATSQGVFSSSTDGTTWSSIDSGMGSIPVGSLVIAPGGIGGTTLFAGTASGVFRSTNDGEQWTSANNGLNAFVRTFAVTTNGVGGSNVFASVDQGVYVTTDYGTTWTLISAGLESGGSIYSIAASKTDLFAATYSGLLRRPLSEVTEIPHHGHEGPEKFELYQNYPNPFNPSTIIRFTLPVSSFVSLKIHDLLGRELSTILAEELPAGEYSRQWNAAGYASGVYLYRLTAGSFSTTKKLLVLR